MPTRLHPLELRLPPPLLALLLAAGMTGLSALAPALDWNGPGSRWIALVLAVLGLSIALAAVLAFVRKRTTISPLAPECSTALVTGGVYRYSRNPMYLGWLLMLVAWGVFLGNPLALLVLPLFVAYLQRFQIQPEERALAQKFGADYAAYRRSVRRWC